VPEDLWEQLLGHGVNSSDLQSDQRLLEEFEHVWASEKQPNGFLITPTTPSRIFACWLPLVENPALIYRYTFRKPLSTRCLGNLTRPPGADCHLSNQLTCLSKLSSILIKFRALGRRISAIPAGPVHHHTPNHRRKLVFKSELCQTLGILSKNAEPQNRNVLARGPPD